MIYDNTENIWFNWIVALCPLLLDSLSLTSLAWRENSRESLIVGGLRGKVTEVKRIYIDLLYIFEAFGDLRLDEDNICSIMPSSCV